MVKKYEIYTSKDTSLEINKKLITGSFIKVLKIEKIPKNIKALPKERSLLREIKVGKHWVYKDCIDFHKTTRICTKGILFYESK